MKGTRLFQRAGSPLIQGRSRRERSFTTDWVAAAAAVLVVGAAVLMLGWFFAPDAGDAGALLDAYAPAILVGVAVAGVGSALGVAFGRGWGLVHPWVGGAVSGVVGGAIGAIAYWLIAGGMR